MVDEIINKLGENSRLDVYLSDKNKREYLKAFIKAQYVTQNIKIGTADPKNSDEFNGVITIQRSDIDGNVSELNYIDYETFSSYVNNANSNVLKYFSIDSKGQLVIAQTYENTKTVESNVPGVDNTTENEYKISATSLDYKTMLDKYTMPFNFLWALLVKSTQEDFAYAVAQLAINSQITIMAYDNSTKTEETENVNFTLHETKDIYYKMQESNINKQITISQKDIENSEYYKKTTNICRTHNVILNVTYANTWISKYTNNYVYEKNSDDTSENETNNTENEHIQILEQYLEPANISGDDYALYKQMIDNEKTATVVSERIKQTITQGLTKNKIISSGNTYKAQTPQVEEKTDQESAEDNFVTLLNKYPDAKTQIMNSSDWFFEMLESSEATSDMIDLVKYLLYKATGESYGVKELSKTWLEPAEFTKINNGGRKQLIEYLHMLEGGYSPKMNSKGTKYIVVDDGYGNLAVGWGVDIFNSGYANAFIEAGYSTEIGAEIDKEFVDTIEEEIISNIEQAVNDRTVGLNLKGYQKDALITRAYNCGVNGALGIRNGITFEEAYKQYWNESTDDYYERKDNNANYSHELYTKYMIDPRTSNGRYSEGLAKRRKSEWTLFQTGYYDVIKQRYLGSSENIVEIANKTHKHMESKNYTYSLNFNQLPLNANEAWNKPYTCCATYVDWVLSEAGYKGKTEKLTHSAPGLFTEYANKGFTLIDSYNKLQPGDIVFMRTNGNDGTGYYKGISYKIGHVQIYVGDNSWYNAGSTESIQRKSPYVWEASSRFVIALRAN